MWYTIYSGNSPTTGRKRTVQKFKKRTIEQYEKRTIEQYEKRTIEQFTLQPCSLRTTNFEDMTRMQKFYCYAYAVAIFVVLCDVFIWRP